MNSSTVLILEGKQTDKQTDATERYTHARGYTAGEGNKDIAVVGESGFGEMKRGRSLFHFPFFPSSLFLYSLHTLLSYPMISCPISFPSRPILPTAVCVSHSPLKLTTRSEEESCSQMLSCIFSPDPLSTEWRLAETLWEV